MAVVEVTSDGLDLVADARKYGIEYSVWRDFSPRERRSVKMNWAKARRAEARKIAYDPDEFVKLDEETRARLIAEYVPPPPGSEPSVDAAPEEAREPDVDDDGMDDGSLDERDDESRPEDRGYHSQADTVPAKSSSPRARSLPTVGRINDLEPTSPVQNEDARKDKKKCETLEDVYERYQINDGEHYIRVERLEPKKYQGIPCGGHIGKITTAMTIEEFHARFGGEKYRLTVFGPDPTGKRDGMGRPIPKRKTDPFEITIPDPVPRLLPPNPDNDRRGFEMYPGWNPFAALYPAPMPGMPMPGMPGMPSPIMPHITTPADAQMFGAALNYQKSRDELAAEEARRRGEQGTNVTNAVVAAVAETAKDSVAEARRNAERAEQRADRENEKLRKEIEELKGKLNGGGVDGGVTGKLVEAVANRSRGEDATEAMGRMRDRHNEELDRLKNSHGEELKRVEASHKEELKRSDERLKALEEHNRRMVSELEVRHKTQVDSLKAEVERLDKQMREQRDSYDRQYKERIDESEKRYQAEITRVRNDERERGSAELTRVKEVADQRFNDLKAQHDRDDKMLKEMHATQVENAKAQLQMKVDNLVERLEEAKEAAEEAREEAAKGKDLPTLLEEAKKTASALGFEEKSQEGGGSALERLASSVGAGLGQSLGNIGEWLPDALSRIQRREAAPQAVRGQMPRQAGGPGGGGEMPQQQAPRRQRRVQASWATEGAPPMDTAPPAQPVASPVQPTNVPLEPPRAEPSQPQAAPPPPPPGANGQAPAAAFVQMFDEESAQAFRANCEQAIDGQMPANIFAAMFYAQFPAQSAELVTKFSHEQAIEFVKQMPDGAKSAILRPDGKRWVAQMWQELRKQQGAQPS